MRRAATQGLGAGKVRKGTDREPAEAPFQPADVDTQDGSARPQPLKPFPSSSHTSGLRPSPAAADSAPHVARGSHADVPSACLTSAVTAGATLRALLHALLISKTMSPLGGDICVKVEKRW